MRLMFVNWAYDNHGSAQDLYNYTRVARALGHEVALYGPPDPNSAFNYSLDIDSADAVVFIFEFTTHLPHSERIGFLRMISRVPRRYRIVIDCDGKYNETIQILGDCNHLDAVSSRSWMDICDSLSGKIHQPTYHPQQQNVRPFFFHAYNPEWEVPLGCRIKPFGMCYVGNNWFRWRPMKRVLEALAPIRGQVGRITLTGSGWDTHLSSNTPGITSDAHYTEPDYLRKLEVEVYRPVRFDQVIDAMSQGILSPVVLRPLFDRLHLVTCRTFETLAADTIPLFCQDTVYVKEIYGEDATELVMLEEVPHQKIMDMLCRPEHYRSIVSRIRQHLADQHSYTARFHELLDIIRS